MSKFIGEPVKVHEDKNSLPDAFIWRKRLYRVVEVLQRIGMDRPLPKTIRVDNGPEFISKLLDQWAYLNRVELDFSRPGMPTDNALIEAFNGCFRQECLNETWFPSLEDARDKVED